MNDDIETLRKTISKKHPCDACHKALDNIVAERKAAIVALRECCGNFGDNDWEDDLDLSEIIQKHFHIYLI